MPDTDAVSRLKAMSCSVTFPETRYAPAPKVAFKLVLIAPRKSMLAAAGASAAASDTTSLSLRPSDDDRDVTSESVHVHRAGERHGAARDAGLHVAERELAGLQI